MIVPKKRKKEIVTNANIVHCIMKMYLQRMHWTDSALVVRHANYL